MPDGMEGSVPDTIAKVFGVLQVRYVIDFYNAAALPNMPVSMYLDARPALDSPGALWDRLRMHWGYVSSGDFRR